MDAGAEPPADADDGVDPRRVITSVVIGVRVAAVAWVAALAAIGVIADGRTPLAVAVGAVLGASVWAGVTVGVGRRDGRLGHPLWLAADALMCAGLLIGPALIAEGPTLAGGYPFSAVVLAAWSVGFRAAIPTGLVLAAATVWRSVLSTGMDAATAAEPVVFYIASAAVLSWGFRVVLDADDRRRAAEAARRHAEAELAAARAAQAVAGERADTAAHLHDSVLQTLAMVQRRADSPDEVVALARAQERDLRTWLFGPRDHSGSAGLAEGLRAVASEIERTHPISVDIVVVGDAAPSDVVNAVVAAAGEAVRNAALHAGVQRVDVYAERRSDQIEVFVRDRGRGFDPSVVPDDRRGVRESIRGRMERHGGTATVVSAADRGTEVVLRAAIGAEPDPAGAPPPEAPRGDVRA